MTSAIKKILHIGNKHSTPITDADSTQKTTTAKMSPLPRRVIIAITSATASFHDGKEPTGLFISEAVHPYIAFKEAGFEVDLVSETGKYYLDWLSQTPDFFNGEVKTVFEDVNGEFRQKLENMPKAADVDGNNYGIFFASAGHAALIDYPTARGLQKIAETVWANGGVVSAVCHGPAIFADIKDSTTGEPIIKGRRITGFTTEGEDELKVMDDLKTWNKPLVEEWAKKLGATYERPAGPWDDFHIVDGRVVTGTQPQSATSTAKAAVEVFEKL